MKTIIYDMTDREKLKKLREVEIEGNYVSSRKIGSELYIVSNKYIDYYSIQNSRENPVPSYRDTLDRDEFTSIDYGSIRYFPGIIQPNYLIVAGIDVNGDSTANIGTYLGAGQNIYASAQNLYITAIDFENRDILPMGGNTDEAQIAPKLRVVPSYAENTIVYKFALKDAKATYLCKGVVPGRVLNQFSMDEYKGYFRIATTTGEVWRTDEQTSKNNLYILDDVLDITGKVEGMAPGETIYSVRFMGNRAYVVTFKTVDPLFVLDLKDPKNPSVLGALKIPGYSDYLHPYDENHIIGFGKDTVEVKGQAYYQGMKLALFDVSDVKNPIQKYTEIIGGRGTDSELLSNHKALLFSKEKNLLAFPVTVMEAENTVDKSEWEFLQYGQFTFQGAYVYNLNLTDGFKLLGRITHMSEEDYIKAGNGWYESDKNVKRILYIDDTLYTLSNVMIKANSLLDMKDRGELKIP
ncbi:MAG: beta-propeller domain-containing protein [Acetivibrionales bacterium]